ncbi:MAG TPA: oxygenase MpaB family protein, partial [Woeseiaceae bacterium]|nr:oxygenase MpaB family protein [Woeseiaceae bacterium]
AMVSDRVTVSHRVNAERLVLLGWSRAILLQFAHPLIAAGIADHSGFRDQPLAAVQRLRQTVRAMLDLTFGSPAESERTLERIRTIHGRVNGQLPVEAGPFAAGTPYSAEEPDLVLWVHATLVESVPMFYEMLIGPLASAERDAYCVEAAPLAVALNARPDAVPSSWAALQAYLDRMYASGQIVVSAQARELAAAVLSPPLGPIGVPGTAMNRLLTVGTLPPGVRSQYGFRWTRNRERAFDAVVRTLRTSRRPLPDRLAKWKAARRLERRAGAAVTLR